MKQLTLFLIGTLTAFAVFSQKDAFTQPSQAQPNLTPSSSVQATPVPITYHGVTGNLIDYIEPAGTVNEITKTEKLGYNTKDDWGLNPNVNPNALPNGDDPILQKNYAPPAPPTKALTQNWDGMGYTGVNPADPSVDVGPNHVVQMINGGSGSYIQVYSKTGTPIGSQVYFDNFMSMPGGAGDPIVLYDERADRWFLSEFSAAGNNLHIAISTTADPTGTYYTYTFNSPGGFPDYPKYSIWENEYVMTANVNTPDIFAFNRADLLAGTATTAQMFSQNNFGTIGFQASTPVSMNGTTLPPSGQPALLMRMRDDAWAGAATDALEMWELDIDWVTPGNSTLSQVQTIGTSPHETELCGYTSFSCIPQLGGTPLDPLRELLMNRIHYRNFGSHESIVCCHVTDVDGADHAGIRWYELRRTGGTGGTWAIFQEGTYAPDADHRWMPSIGISATGNIGLAYSVASSSTAPSLRYTGRKECDPLGTMTEPETNIVAGTTANGSNRWGDYFQMGCDPSDGETFYFTGCYNTSSQWSTRIAAFDLPSCSPQVAFGGSTYTVNEVDASQANGCLPYDILNVPISIGADPSQPAGITVNVTGGTATNNVDYAVQNNTFTFDGATLSGNVVIWVYNDDYVEGNETITLDYTLNANGGDASAGSFNQTVTITINDDDIIPTAAINPTPVVLLTQDFESGLAPFTSQQAAGANAWVVGLEAAAASGNFPYPGTNTTNFAYVNDDDCNCDMSNNRLNILPAVDLTNYLAGAVTFDSYFFGLTYNGATESMDLQVNVNNGGWNTVGNVVNGNPSAIAWVAQSFDISAYCGNPNVRFRIRYNDGGDWLYGAGVDNVVISGQTGIDIQQPINTGAGMQANLGPNETVHFYDPTTGDVMMTLDNTSGFDYGCVDVEVDRAGTSAAQFNTATVADYLMSKTYTVVPTNTNPTGTFDVTLYYTEAEVAGWEAATGNSRNSAEIIKVAGANAINDVNPGNAGTFTIANNTATLGSFYSDVTFTSSFSTGFSGFGVGIYNPLLGTPPVANFSATPTTICAGETVTFTDLSTNGPTGWSWDFGDAGTSTAQNPTHVYAAAGTYTVTLTATNGSGSDPFTITNYITVNAIPTVVASGASTICDVASATITGSGATTYSWDQGLGAGGSQTVSPTTTTTYIVTGTTAGCTNTDAVTITVTPVPTVTANGATTICEGASATISGSGAATYSWDQGLGAGGSQTVSPITTTTYTVTGTTAGCSNTDAVTITVTPVPTVIANGATTICDGASATISGSGAATYSWDQGLGAGGSQTVSPTTTTTYTVTGTTAGCSNTDAVTITVTPLPSVIANGATTICDGSSATISGSGATTYSWDQGLGAGGSQTVSPTTTTTYTVTGTTAGCSNTDAVTIAVTPLPIVVATGTIIICDGSSTTIAATGATTYAWDQGVGAGASQIVSPTSTTTYTVTGTAAGCTNTDAVTVTVNPQPAISILAANNPATCGTTTGSIQVGGSGTGDVSWTGTASGSVAGVPMPYTITGLAAGSYTINYTDGNGCVSNTLVQSISDPSAPTVVATGSTIICDGASVNISASGAATYTWDQGVGSGANQTVSPSTTTTYTVTGILAGCTGSDAVTVTVNPVPTVVASGTSTICDGASVTISGSGATTYAWDQGLGAGNSQTVTPSTTTTYTVTGTTAGCSNTDAVTITVTPLPTVVATGTTTICDGASVTISGSGATTYAWDQGLGAGASQSVSPTSTTTYTVTGTSAGCTNTDAVTVTVNPTPAISVMAANNPATCATSTGSIQIGGSGTGNISWTGTASGSATGVPMPYTITGLAAGSYTITYTDGNGCLSNTLIQSLADPSAPPVVATGSTTICDGASVSIAASGATTYSWDQGVGAGATQTVSPSTTTTYTVTGTTAGCTATDVVTVTVNPVPTVVANGTTAICDGASVTISGSGATSYSWDQGLGAGASQTVSPTSTTTYTVTGTTGACSNTDQVTITVNPIPSVTGIGTTTICEGGSVNINATGATTYSWDQGLGAGASQTVSPTTTTSYTVTGTTSGCTATDVVTVTVNPVPTVVANGTTAICAGTSVTISGSGATSYSWDQGLGAGASQTVSPTSTTTYTLTGTTGGCSNTDQVTITVNPIPTVTGIGSSTICEGSSLNINATGAATYMWDQGLGAGASQTVSPTVTTSYTVTGTSAGCSNTDVVTVTVNPVPTVVASGTSTICEGASVTISGSGATTYTWDQGLGAGASQTVSPTSTTTFTVIGTSAGCSSTDQVTITVNPIPTVTAIGATTICDGSSTPLNATGAASYSWDQGLGTGASQTVSPSTTTTYTVTGTSAGCSNTDQVTITVNPSPTVVGTGTSTVCAGTSVTLDATGATTYAWDQGVGAGATQTVTPLVTTTYTVTGTTAGCTGTDQVTITVNPLPTVVATGTTSICEGNTVTLDATGATTYSWDQGLGAGATQTVSPTTTTTYTVTGTSGACSNTDQVTVTVTPAPVVVATGTMAICEGSSTTIDATGATSYAWDQGLGAGSTQTVSPTATTTYTVTGTTAGCSGTDQVTITVNPLPIVSMTPSLDTICDHSSPITLVGSPAGGNFTGNGVSGSLFDPAAAGSGTHTITYDYTDNNSCSNSIDMTVVVENCAGITENVLQDVQLFPNPNDGKFMIKGLAIGTVFKIYDDRGRLVMDGIVQSETQEIEMPDPNNGMYYLRAEKDGKEGGIKFLIAQ